MYAYPYNYNGDIPYKNITLETLVAFPAVADTIPISEVMDTQGGHLCYTFV
jgi:tyrosinase